MKSTMVTCLDLAEGGRVRINKKGPAQKRRRRKPAGYSYHVVSMLVGIIAILLGFAILIPVEMSLRGRFEVGSEMFFSILVGAAVTAFLEWSHRHEEKS